MASQVAQRIDLISFLFPLSPCSKVFPSPLLSSLLFPSLLLPSPPLTLSEKLKELKREEQHNKTRTENEWQR